MPKSLYPLRFAPIFKTAIWGGDALRPMLGAAPSPEPTGEAWLLSDHGDNVSRVVDGPLAHTTLRDLMLSHKRELIGNAATANDRFPILLKLLDARQPLSVQVHPDDRQARRTEPSSNGLGKTEAWVIIKADPGATLFAGLRSGISRHHFHSALAGGSLPDLLHSYTPAPGDCIFLEAGTVHAIGAGVVLFEVQQTSDITYRLDDWGRVDAKTGKPRELHIDKALACVNYQRGPCNPVKPSGVPGLPRKRLVSCQYFTMDRIHGAEPFDIGCEGKCRIAVCIDGEGSLIHQKKDYRMKMGDVLLLPASIGNGQFVPKGIATLLECSLSES